MKVKAKLPPKKKDFLENKYLRSETTSFCNKPKTIGETSPETCLLPYRQDGIEPQKL